jgi:nucleotide-binding universal stress UspA family protein
VDLIVMGNHGLGDVKRFLLGSTSDRVMQYAACPVLIVRPDHTGDTDDSMLLDHPLHILLACDDSRHARYAAEFCASLPMAGETEVTALSVLPLVTLYRQDVTQQLEWMWKEKRKVAEAGLAWVTENLDWKTQHLRTRIEEHPDVSEAIVDAADEFDVDMVVIGDKGTGAIKRFLLGSITRRIAHHAPCSVLVVRQKPGK